MAPYYFEEELVVFLSGLLSSIPSMALGIVSYVLTALAIYTIAERRGLQKPWIAWIPVVNCWLLGSISDQYQYVAKGQNKTKRKTLLTLGILQWVLSAVILLLFGIMVGMLITDENGEFFGLAMAVLGLVLPVAGIAIAYTVIRYMALFDVFRSLDPDNAVLFLVLSILVGVTEPFFLFFNRQKDGGMPPRKQSAYIPPREPEQEPWVEKDYL